MLSNVGSVLPVRLVAQGDGNTSYFILNRAVGNFCLVGPDVGIAQQNQNEYSLIDPLGSLTVSDAQDWYAICGTPGASCEVDVTPNATNASVSPAVIAEQIALAIGTFSTSGLALETTLQDTNTSVNGVPTGISVAGVPLLTKSTVILSTTATLPAAGVFNSGVLPVTQIGYEVTVSFQSPAGETVTAPADVTLMWGDPSTTSSIDEDEFQIASSTTVGGCLVVGSGPTKGSTLVVNITNDGTANLTYTIVVMQNSRVYLREDWHSLASTANPVVSATNANVPTGLIASSSISIAAGTVVNRLLPLYQGLVEWCVIPPAQSGQFGIQTLDHNAPVADLITLEPLVASTALNFQHPLSRAQCQINIKNTGAATGIFAVLGTVVETPG